MNFSFFKKKSSTAHTYLGLFLKESRGEVMIIESVDKDISISHSESFDYSNSWENLTNDIEEIWPTIYKNDIFYVLAFY